MKISKALVSCVPMATVPISSAVWLLANGQLLWPLLESSKGQNYLIVV